MNIDSLNLSIRARNALISAGVDNVEQLIDLDLDKLNDLRNAGEKTIAEIIWKMLRMMRGDVLKMAKEFDEYGGYRADELRKYREIKAIVNRK